MTYVIAYIATAIVFFGLDFIWLSKSIGFYRSHIGDLLLDQPNFVAAGLFYVFYIAGIVYLAVVPNLQNGSWSSALLAGAVLGFLAYGTYDMTNLSTLKGWSVTIVIADLIWGTFLTGVAATAGYLITSRFVA
ncbi:DUF2177 family protein [Rhizobium halophytocola]|uniref:Membrane protein n=1 Tax=Rhizobium halophytocola TaxID=735519 RepID=A0ABS4DTP2_9HYPH|nr:DUF2177 family protein [Rhizobium halophytocola]MBP1849072.1 putative membrane protein [Rhizobium halophytocola]